MTKSELYEYLEQSKRWEKQVQTERIWIDDIIDDCIIIQIQSYVNYTFAFCKALALYIYKKYNAKIIYVGDYYFHSDKYKVKQ
jgi:hypothetical protein